MTLANEFIGMSEDSDISFILEVEGEEMAQLLLSVRRHTVLLLYDLFLIF